MSECNFNSFDCFLDVTLVHATVQLRKFQINAIFDVNKRVVVCQ